MKSMRKFYCVIMAFVLLMTTGVIPVFAEGEKIIANHEVDCDHDKIVEANSVFGNPRGLTDECQYGGSHSFEYVLPDGDWRWEEYHIVACKKCNYSYNQDHSFYYLPIVGNDDTHRRSCSKCSFYDTDMPHSYMHVTGGLECRQCGHWKATKK